MTTKEEWLDYFELVNGRKSSSAEFLAAKKNGEITGEANEKYLARENVGFIEPKIEDKKQVKPINSYTAANRNPNRAVDKKSAAVLAVVLGTVFIIVGTMVWQLRVSTYSSLDAVESIKNLIFIGTGIVLLFVGIMRFYKLNKK